MSACSPAFGELQRVPGTSVIMNPPKSFGVALNFPGFGRPDGASIMVTEVPDARTEVEHGMTKEALATKGITLLESKTIKVGGENALLFKVSQRGDEKEFLKLIMLAGDDHQTTIVTGTYPKESAAELEDAIKRSILSVTWAAPPADPLEGLLYQIQPTEKLKLAGRIGNMLMFNESGRPGPLPTTEARYLVSNSLNTGAIGDLRSFSEERAANTATLKDVKPLSGRELTVDGLQGYELVADAKNNKADTPTRLYQVVAAGETGYFIMQGVVPPERAAEFIPEFQRLTASFHRKPLTRR